MLAPVEVARSRFASVVPTRTVVISCAGVAAAMLIGALAAVNQTVIGLALAAVVLASILLVLARRVRSWFVLGSTLLLGGYVVLTRGFSGLNVPLPGVPLYVGEMLLVLLVPVALWRGWRTVLALGAPATLLIVWMAYNAILTLRDFPAFGVNAIHDAATWYYGLYFAVGLVLWQKLGARGIRRTLAPVFVLAPAAAVISLGASQGWLPVVQAPILDTPLFTSKTDIVGMQLLVAAAFFLTASSVSMPSKLRALTPVVVGSAVAFIAVGQNRATFIGLVGLMLLLAFYRMWRPILAIVGVSLAFMLVLAATDVQIAAGDKSSDFSSIVQRELSVFDFSSDSYPAASGNAAAVSNVGTISWRLLWWQALWNDAVANPDVMLFGRGFGYDLRNTVAPYAPGGVVYVFAQNEDHPLRSPHNIAMTLLGRTGLVGLALWLAMLSACFVRLLRATILSRRARDGEQELLGVWFITALAVIVVVALFGVVLEAPHAAIPFFIILGAAIGWATGRLRQAAPA